MGNLIYVYIHVPENILLSFIFGLVFLLLVIVVVCVCATVWKNLLKVSQFRSVIEFYSQRLKSMYVVWHIRMTARCQQQRRSACGGRINNF